MIIPDYPPGLPAFAAEGTTASSDDSASSAVSEREASPDPNSLGPGDMPAIEPPNGVLIDVPINVPTGIPTGIPVGVPTGVPTGVPVANQTNHDNAPTNGCMCSPWPWFHSS